MAARAPTYHKVHIQDDSRANHVWPSIHEKPSNEAVLACHIGEGDTRKSFSWSWTKHSRRRVVNMLCALALVAGFFALRSLGGVLPGKYPPKQWPSLRFTSDGTFQIAVFEDLHFGESTFGTILPPIDLITNLIICRCMGNMGSTARHQLSEGAQ